MRSLKNNKGSFFALISGMVLIIGGILVYIMINPIFEGTDGNGGMFGVAERDMGIDNSTGSTLDVMRKTWKIVPWSFVISGFLVIIMDTQRRDFFQNRVGF